VEIIREIFNKALQAVDPYFKVREHAEKIRVELLNGGFNKLFVIGFGKASYQMACAVEDVFTEEEISAGIIVIKYGHACMQGAGTGPQRGTLKKIKVFEAAHPVPDEKGLEAAREIIHLVQTADEKTLVLCLISGGGSALFASPCEGITLKEKQEVTDLLMRAGADINELNAVRKHISGVKGGRLAEMAFPATVISLLVSDVIGDYLDVIASGPTAPDTSTFSDALEIMDRYNLSDRVSSNVTAILQKGAKGEISDTPDKNSRVFDNVRNIILCSNQLALEAAKKCAQSQGYDADIISSTLTGEARTVGVQLAQQAKKIKAQIKKNQCCIYGGETTVTVTGKGKGGRNTEMALSFAREIEGIEGVTFLSAGTDGTDGPTDAAGAIVNGQTIAESKKLGLDSLSYLSNNDSYSFFDRTGSLVKTGPTGTNVMDIQVVLIEND
jgi:glycerate-2-kinase